MDSVRKQLSAEEITRKGEQAQKMHDRKKRAVEKCQPERQLMQRATIATIIAPLQNIGIDASPGTARSAGALYSAQNIVGSKGWRIQLLEDREVQQQNADWPWVGAPSKLLTQAPYAISEYNAGHFRSPEAIQISPLFNVHNGIQYPILHLLFRYHSCASKFATTCQAAFHMAAAFIDHWDITRGHFNTCDKGPRDTSRIHTASVGRIVVVTPFRVRKWRGENYKCELFGLHNMTQAFSNYADRFEILHLHRIPLLTTHLLALVVPAMRKLKVLGVYRCEIIHFGDTMRILEILRKDRGAGKTRNIALDFYPRFHVGPVPAQGSIYHTGSYGVTWDNFGLDSRLAIWQLLTKVLPQAKRQGVDLVGKDAAFKLWLDHSPCWRVDETIMAILDNWKDDDLAVQVDYPHTRGKRSKLPYYGEGCLSRHLCRGCEDNVLGIFFDFDEYSLHAWPSVGTYTPLCLGCKLKMHLDYETDHKKQAKVDMIRWWLDNDDGTMNEDNILRALSQECRLAGMRAAEFYDRERKKLAKKNLGPERQAPFKEGYTYSPDIRDREPTGYW